MHTILDTKIWGYKITWIQHGPSGSGSGGEGGSVWGGEGKMRRGAYSSRRQQWEMRKGLKGLAWEKKTEWRGKKGELRGLKQVLLTAVCSSDWAKKENSREQKRLFSNLSWDKPGLMPSPIYVNRGWCSLVIPSILAWVSFCLKTFQRPIYCKYTALWKYTFGKGENHELKYYLLNI